MKRYAKVSNVGKPGVAPFVGAWIETLNFSRNSSGVSEVAPFVGAWIETVKYRVAHAVNPVAPFAGARIEIAG